MSATVTATVKLKRRAILGGVAASAGAALLAACGGTTTATTAPTAAPAATVAATTAATKGAATTAPAAASPAAASPAAATTAPATGATTAPAATTAGASVATTAPAAAASPAASTSAGGAAAATGTGALKPNTTADAFKGKSATFFQKLQYYMAVQASIKDAVTNYTKSVGASVDVNTQGPDAGPNLTKIQAGVQAMMPFDMMDDISPGPGQLINLNLLTDVTDFVKQLSDAYGTPMPIFPPGISKDGKYYAVPFFSSSDAWFVRKDKCAAKGIDPASIDTYEKARDAALAISDPANRFYGWGFSPYAAGDAAQLITHVVHSFGGSIQDKTGTKVTWNSPETVAGITFLADIYTNPKYKNMLPPGYESWDGSGNNMAWLNGTIGMTANAFTLYAKAHDDKNPVFEQTYVLPRPKGPGTMNGALRGGQLGYFAIPKGAKNADLMKETIKYIMQPEQWIQIASKGGGLILPAYESQWKNDFFKSDPNFATLEAQVRDTSGYNQYYYPGPITPGADGVIAQKVLENMMSEIIQKNVKVPEAVKTADDQIRKIYEQFGVKQ